MQRNAFFQGFGIAVMIMAMIVTVLSAAYRLGASDRADDIMASCDATGAFAIPESETGARRLYVCQKREVP